MFGLLLACVSAPEPASVEKPLDVPWLHERTPLTTKSASGRRWHRGIIHLHSYFSHDACDNHEMADEPCFADFRKGLCDAAIDFAYVTDHPSTAAEHTYEELLLSEPDDEIVDGVANRIHCASGHDVLTMPGIEDELMPVGLTRQVAETAEENDRLYNNSDAEAVAADIAAGAVVLQAHTEGKPLADLQERQANGLSGVEMFNLHAMVDPNKREQDLGLDRFGYLEAIAPFMSGETQAESDLAFLAFYEEQGVSLEKWDTLNAAKFTIGTAGTDAHENTIPSVMNDGERGDSYRRMMSWFSNVLLVDGDGPTEHKAALAAGRMFVAFEALGTPADFEATYNVNETTLEMGGEAPRLGTLSVSCPTLSVESPQSGNTPPDISVTVLKDGQTWQTSCGEWTVSEVGVYRVRVDIVPNHLAGFLDNQADSLIHRYPWLYSNAFRITD